MYVASTLHVQIFVAYVKFMNGTLNIFVTA